MLKEVRFHPYKIQIAQQRLNRDKEVRAESCIAKLSLLRKESEILNILFMPAKLTFHVSECVSKQNTRCWSPVNFQEKLLYFSKVTVWCEIAVFEPYFFGNNK